MKKYYALRNSIKNGIYTSLEEINYYFKESVKAKTRPEMKGFNNEEDARMFASLKIIVPAKEKKQRYYVVTKGFKTGVYTSLEDATKYIKGYPYSSMKSFKNIDIANDYLEKNTKEFDLSNTYNYSSDLKEILNVYVDGSYSKELNNYAMGVVFCYKDEILYTLSELGKNTEYLKYCNITGELFATIIAIKYSLFLNIKEINLHYDFHGIKEWQNNKIKHPLACIYRNCLNEIKDKLKINFIKVDAHSGNKHNNLADKLAKLAFKKSNNLLDQITL